jgi:hypothetical protein
MSPHYTKYDKLQWYILSEKAVIQFNVNQIVILFYTVSTSRDATQGVVIIPLPLNPYVFIP